MDYNQAIQVLENEMECVNRDGCDRACCARCDLAMEKEDVLAALNLAIRCLDNFAYRINNSKRPIDANDLYDRLDRLENRFLAINMPITGMEQVRSVIGECPTLDVATVVHAHWVIVQLTESTPITVRDHCSNCRAPHPYIHGSDECTAHFPPRCPCCDALMDEEV